jgi:serine/threonine protein kinase
VCPCWLPHRAGCKPAPLALPCFQADFGLSKTLPINKHAEYGYLDSKFRLTGETGSYRYMAPEVFRHEPYNSRVDVYSFSMIVYQLFEVGWG